VHPVIFESSSNHPISRWHGFEAVAVRSDPFWQFRLPRRMQLEYHSTWEPILAPASATALNCTVVLSHNFLDDNVNSRLVSLCPSIMAGIASDPNLSDDLCPTCQTRFLTKPKVSQGYHTPDNVGRMYRQVSLFIWTHGSHSSDTVCSVCGV
jgi:hypothetical protein